MNTTLRAVDPTSLKSGPEFRGQYLILPAGWSAPIGIALRRHAFGSLDILTGPHLSVVTARHDKTNVCVIGEIIAPDAPGLGNEAVGTRLAERGRSLTDLIDAAASMSGRFVVLYDGPDGRYAFNDACGFRQIFHGWAKDELILTSSPGLFFRLIGSPPELAPGVRRLMSSQDFQRSEHAWYGDRFFDERLGKVLPNHVLDLEIGSSQRSNRQIKSAASSTPELVRRAAAILRGTYEGLARRYDLVQAVTAGWDSRVLLAASLPWASSIRYFVFDEPTGHSADAEVAGRLGHRLGLSLETAMRPPLSESFLERFRAEFPFPREIGTLRNVQWQYDQPVTGRMRVNVNGNGGEIGRCFFGAYGGPVSTHLLSTLSGYGTRYDVIVDALKKWKLSAWDDARRQNVSMLDLFYWEQRMGNWGALGAQEMDLAVEQVSPFDNHELLGVMLSVPAAVRNGPDYHLFRMICEVLAPEVLAEPINPDTSRTLTRIRSNVGLRYIVQASVQSLKALRSGFRN